MSVRSKILAAATVAAMAGGVVAASAGTASAATPSCGIRCLDVYSSDFGTSHKPGFVLDAYKQGSAVGTALILFRAGNNDPAEDFTVSEQGTVNDFFKAGLVSSAVNLHYGCVAGTGTGEFSSCTGGQVNDYAYELQYAPYGADTGLCAGVATTAAANIKVSLQPCGTSSKTVWILDTSDSVSTLPAGKAPLINGSDTNFSQPFVLTYPSSSYPTDTPRPQLYTASITGEASGTGPVEGTVDDNQLWSAGNGVLP